MIRMSRMMARRLLAECTGRDIWSVAYCREQQVPDDWIEELADCFESGFHEDLETIYLQERPVNQYHGLRDVDLAKKLAEFLGVDVSRVCLTAWSPMAVVQALKEAVDE